MKSYQKILLSIGIILLLVYAGIHVYFSFYLEDSISETIVEEVNSAAGGRYNIDIANLNLNIIGRELQLEGITLRTTDDASGNLEVTIEAISLSGVNIWRFVNNRDLFIDRIDIVSPSITITDREEDGSKGEFTDINSLVATEILKVLEEVSISEIAIHTIEFDLKRIGEENSYFSFSNSDLNFYNTKVDSSSVNSDKVLPVDDMEGTIRNSRFRTSGNLYEITSERIEFSSFTKAVTINDMNLVPVLSENEFFETVGYRTDRLQIYVPEARFNGIDFDELLQMESVNIEEIELNEADVRVFRNKKYPQRENRPDKLLPQQVLQNLEFLVRIDTVLIADSYIRYTELEEFSEEKGHVFFSSINATITNTTNRSEYIDENSNWVFEAEADVMDKSRLNARFILPYRELNHSITGTLASMDVTELNRIFEPVALIRINEGQIHSIDFEMDLGENESNGKVKIIYEGLNISLLDKDSQEENFGTRISSFIANTFAVKSDNSEENPRIGEVSFERDHKKSVFNYWWKSLQSGLESSL
jgi:hypothetical protein